MLPLLYLFWEEELVLIYLTGDRAKTAPGLENSITWMDHQYQGYFAGRLEGPWMGKIQTEQLKTDYFVACSSTAPNSNQGKNELGEFFMPNSSPSQGMALLKALSMSDSSSGIPGYLGNLGLKIAPLGTFPSNRIQIADASDCTHVSAYS
ncbi:hypothetical protein ACFX1R_031723 [Malus domestica]